MGAFDWGAFGQSAANGALGQLFSWFGAKQQHKRNKELMSLQNDYTMQQMAQSNEYWQQQNETQVGNQMQLTRQNPILQMEGVRQAGMNPNAQFSGNVAAAPSGTNAPSGNGTGNPGASNPFTSMVDLFGQMNELKIQKQQQALIKAQERVANAEAQGKEIDNKYKDSGHTFDIQLTQQQIETNRQQRQTLLSEMYRNDSQRAQIDKETEWMDVLNAEQQNVLQRTAEKYMAEAKLDLERINTEKSQQALNKSQQALNVHLGNQADAAAEKYRAEAEESRQRAATEAVARSIKIMERDLIGQGISPNDASAFSTTLRRVVFHPEYYGGKDKAVEFINKTIATQFQSDVNKQSGSGPFGILDIWKYLEGHSVDENGHSHSLPPVTKSVDMQSKGVAGKYTYGAIHGH